MPTHYKGAVEERAALNAYIALMRAADSVTGRITRKLAEEGLTMSQLGVLESLLHLGSMSQKTLAEKLLKSGGNITLVVDNLEKGGLVKRERSKEDRRVIFVCLTPEGQKRIEDFFPCHVRDIVEEMGVLEIEEQETLRALCKRLGLKSEKN